MTEFYKAQAMRLPTYDKPRIIGCAQDHPHHIGLPRGCLSDLQRLLSELKITHSIQDEPCVGQSLDVVFHGQLRSEQRDAADGMSRP